MGLLDKLKKKVKEQEQKQEKENKQTGDRTRNKVKDDNSFGDKQAEKEGSGGSPKTPREKSQRKSFGK